MAQTRTERLLVDSDDAAVLCGVSRTMWWTLHAQGRVPAPVRLGRRTLWRVDELRRWTEAGCPPREKWLMQQGDNGNLLPTKNRHANTT